MRRPFLMLAALGLTSTACGASIQAIYEGDVRFEHCMALDARPDVKPTLRRACWEEWVKFYTFGQTRDRVDYAGLRQAQLGSASDFDEGTWVPPRAAAPDPTGALAPPPMMAAYDAGADSGEAPKPSPSAEVKPVSDCAAACEAGLTSCLQGCKGAACPRACTERHKRCVKRCN